MNSKKIITYLGLTFLITYTSWFLLAYLSTGFLGGNASVSSSDPIYMILLMIGGLAPTYVAFIAVKFSGEEGDMKEYLSRVKKWRVKPIWYAAIFLPILLIGLGQYFLSTALFAKNPETIMYALFIPAFVSNIVGGGFEEFGWRGLLLPELQKKYDATISTLIVGVIWVIWHIPLWFIADTSQQGINFLFFALIVMLMNFMFTWFYNNTKSIFLTIFFHAFINTLAAISLISFESYLPSQLILGGLYLLAVIILFVVYDPKNFIDRRKG